MSEMSAKVSNVYRQSKGRLTDNKLQSKPVGSRFANGSNTSTREVEEDVRDRELLVFDLTNKWGPCHGMH